MKKKPAIAKTNNLGGLREALTADSILKRSNYSFKLSIVRSVFNERELKNFVQKYWENRRASMDHRPPTAEEVKVFGLYDAGTISLEEAALRFNLPKTTSVKTKLGKIYAYLKEKQRVDIVVKAAQQPKLGK